MIGSEDNFDEKYSSIFNKEETPSESNVVNPSEDSTPQVSKPEETPAITQERKVLSIPAWEKDQDVTYFKILGRNSLLSTESVLFVDKTSNFIYDDIIAAHVERFIVTRFGFGYHHLTFKHCNRWILLPSKFGYEDPVRVDEKCYKEHCGIDFGRNYDVYGSTDAPTIVLLHPELGNRSNFKYQVEAWASKYRVIVVDLPNHGSREKEIFKMDKAIDSVVSILEKECGTQKVLLGGVSLGGYVAVLVAKKHPELIAGLVLASSCYETYGATKQVLYSSLDAILFACPDALKWKIFPNLFSSVPLKDLEDPILRAGVNYDAWPTVSYGMTEPSQDYFLRAIHAFPGKIFFINGEKEKRPAEQKFVAASAKSRLHVMRGGSSVSFLEPTIRDEFNSMVEDFAKEVFGQ